MKTKLLLSFLIPLLVASVTFSQPSLEFVPFADGFTNPVGIVSAGDERLFIIQQGGIIQIVNQEGDVMETPFIDLTEKVNQTGNERGLLGLAFHPQYAENGFFFVNYTRAEDGTTVVSRFSVDTENDNAANPESEKILLTIQQPYQNHNGGNLLFGPDGYLYIFTGDGGSGGDPENNAQNFSLLLGKILRIDVDNGDPFAIPEDNPFAHEDEVRNVIWATGLRNPWRNSFDSYTGDLWIADVGQSSFEEINYQPFNSIGGVNYGWRCYEGTKPFNQEGCEDMTFYTFPVFEYPHQGNSCTGSVTGGYVYRGALHNNLFGVYIAADFCRGEVYYVKKVDEIFESGSLGFFLPFEYTSFGEDPYGELYVALRSSGEIHMVTDTSDCKPVARIRELSPMVLDPAQPLTLNAFYHPQLQYQWSVDGTEIEGATAHTLAITTEGNYTVEVVNPENNCSNTSDAFEVLPEGTTSVIPVKFTSTRIYPNPATHNIYIEGLPTTGENTIELTDINGRLLSRETISNSKANIDISSFAKGILLIRLTHADDVMVRRVIIR